MKETFTRYFEQDSMYFNKYPYISNFEFVKQQVLEKNSCDIESTQSHTWRAPAFSPERGRHEQEFYLDVEQREGDVYVIQARGEAWETNHAQSELSLPPLQKKAQEGDHSRLELGEAFELCFKSAAGHDILKTVEGESFGKAGEAHMFQFEKPEDVRCYGMGEKMLGLELSNVKTKFWNTDVWADYNMQEILNDRPDPMYVSVPYLIVKAHGHWVGLLLDNPCATFMKTDASVRIADQMDANDQEERQSIVLGSESGQPRLIVVVAKSLAELTQKSQSIMGKTPLPPVWSLGYHQCRWGYESMDDLRYLDAGMDKHEIPCDALWLDIEYMRGYRVFTFEKKNFPNIEQNLAEIQSPDKAYKFEDDSVSSEGMKFESGISEWGRRVVPIIDPGVKVEEGYEVFESGQSGGHYCLNPQGTPFVGLVWPGETVFPDYSMPTARAWWAEQVKGFAEKGIHGVWLDMNDPATGDSLNALMHFNEGKNSHETFHNQYGMGMARASRDGMLQAHPNERPFLLSRSGFTGMSKYAAIWTGDNVSSYHYLKNSIPCSINLALSGIPFNGPDVGGFGFDTNPQLLIDWIKTGFMFPILRNHSIRGSRSQEPWAFDWKTRDIYRHYVQLRYKLRPYLYNLFMDQEERGEAILRPIFYDFEDEVMDLSRVDDQFMVGPALLQAPFVEEGQDKRSVVLPSGAWFDVAAAQWLVGGTRYEVQKDEWASPLYLREGQILPLARNQGVDHRYHAKQMDLHVIVDAKDGAKASAKVCFDDGLSFEYRDQGRSEAQVEARVSGDCLDVEVSYKRLGFGEADFRVCAYAEFKEVRLNGRLLSQQAQDFDWGPQMAKVSCFA